MNRTEHLLSCLAEECCEVGQRVSKALRFGLSEVQPGQPFTNADRIMHEFHDLLTVVEMLHDNGTLPAHMIPSLDTRRAKRAKIEKFMAISREQGVLSDDRR